MTRALPAARDEFIIIEALRSYANHCLNDLPRHRHTDHGIELARRARRVRVLADEYERSLPSDVHASLGRARPASLARLVRTED